MDGPYTVQFDFWINANGPFPAGGRGSTEYVGGAVGFDPAGAPQNGAAEQKTYTAEEQHACSIEAMMNGGECEACQ